MAGTQLWKRQSNNGGAFDNGDDYGDDGYNDGYDSWWWSSTGMAVRYAILPLLFGCILLFLLIGYYSTQRRLRRGQQPRPLFRWMVRRREAYHNPQRYQYPLHGGQQQAYAHYADPNSQGYGMNGYPAPPPPYVNGEMPPPVYQPPQGASKAMPDQNVEAIGSAGEASSSAGVEQPPPAART